MPVPHATWKRGTELPCPSARRSPRPAQPTTGVRVTPRPTSQSRFSPAAHSTYAGPPHRPAVLVVEPVELRAALPVAPRQLEGVLDAEAALLRRVDEEQPAEGPEGLAAEVVGTLLVDQRDGAAGGGELGGGDEAGEPGPDDEDVGAGQRNETCSAGTVPAVRPGAVW